MSKRRLPPTVNLADYKAKKAEEGSIPIDLGNGEIIRTRSPFILSDDDMAKLNQAAADDDAAALGKVLLSEDEYARFLEAGGTGALLSAILDEFSDPGPDADPEGEASSDS